MNWEIETKMMAHEELACVAFWAAVRDQVSEASPGFSAAQGSELVVFLARTEHEAEDDASSIPDQATIL